MILFAPPGSATVYGYKNNPPHICVAEIIVFSSKMEDSVTLDARLFVGVTRLEYNERV